jgi:hypothetical protein
MLTHVQSIVISAESCYHMLLDAEFVNAQAALARLCDACGNVLLSVSPGSFASFQKKDFPWFSGARVGC